MTPERAFQALMPRFEAVPPDACEQPRYDVRAVALSALMVAEFVAREPVRARFARLASVGELELRHVDDLALLARALLHILTKLGRDTPGAGVAISADLMREARTLEQTMLNVFESRAGDTADARAIVEYVRLAAAPPDLAQNLRVLADAYRDYKDVLGAMYGVGYDTAHEAEARELATRVDDDVASVEPAERAGWRFWLECAWALFQAAYDDVGRAGRFLFHADRPLFKFPPMIVVATATRRLRKPEGPTSMRARVPSLTGEDGFAEVRLDELVEIDDSAAAARDNGSITVDVAFDMIPTKRESVKPPKRDSVKPPKRPSKAPPKPKSNPPAKAAEVKRAPSPPVAPVARAPEPKSGGGKAAAEVKVAPPSPSTAAKPSEPKVAAAAAKPVPLPPSPPPKSSPFSKALPATPLSKASSPTVVTKERPLSDDTPTAPPPADAPRADASLPSRPVPSAASMNPASRRGSPRLDVKLVLSIGSGEELGVGVTENLSETGAFIVTSMTKPIGTKLTLMLTPSGDAEPLALKGQVRWVRSGKPPSTLAAGMGIQFDGLSVDDKARIRKIVSGA